ncbi:hypothetical protein GCM10010435_58910 [Winogradskya consettensis]|uniref:2Fe-2S iron-sulfur cluster binding domain-containing protein n=1 Tax=Winogradskya consettensis TaxID=113560 RepID=A0A919SP44_9ACTN|nr:2Fe-2S iron-sulfur cluster-binding protein [Actinoplanes consettensis]GIM74253.1 hypothetical protein Aco04nite_39370 [Actinoplanes consettensis]
MQLISTVAGLEAIIGEPMDAVMRKQVDALDEGCRRVLAAAPIAGLGYCDADGRPRTTVVGGWPGFAEVESPRRISVRLPQGEAEPVPGGGVSFAFLLPGVGEVLRLNGSSLATGTAGRLVVAVEQAYVHCARAVGRSGLWAAPRPGPAAAARTDEGPLTDPRVAAFLAATPFLVVSSWDAAGGSDSSPRGDNPGFLRVLDGRTLAVPDRRGNKRADTMHNLLTDDRLSLVALVPGRLEVLRLSGRAELTDDPSLLRTMAVGTQIPHAAMVLTVSEAIVGPSDAIASSQVWDRTRHVDLNAVPDLNALAAIHLASNMSQGIKGRMVRLLVRQLGRFPRVTRPLTAAMFSKQLQSEGYGPNPQTAPTPGRTVRVAEVIRETADATTLVLEDGAAFDFLPGQFFTLVLDIGGRVVRRAYSASSAPGSTRLTLTVKATADGYASAHVRDSVRPGAELRILGPSGSFSVDRPAKELVLMAAGSGITPMMSIIRSTLAGAHDTRITLLYGNRAESGIIFSAALADLARAHPGRLTVHHVLSRPGQRWRGRRGRLDQETVRSLLAEAAPGDEAHFYSCGPAGMLTGVAEVLDDLGVPAARRHEETFASLAVQAGEGTEQTMTIGDLGTVTVAAGQTLLDAGLEAALPLPYSCTVGSCGECRIRLTSGEVTMAEPNCLSPADRDNGYILACVAQPRTAVTVEITGVQQLS